MIITFCTKKYFELSKALARSIIKFTDFEISIFTYGFTTNQFINDRVKIVNTESYDHNDWTNNLYYKFLTCYNSPYDKTFYLDSDIVITKTFQNWVVDEVLPFLDSNNIFSCQHPQNPSANNSHFANQINHTPLSLFNKKIENYIFAAAFAFNKDFKIHFQNMYNLSQKINHKPITGDEAIFNSYLTENGISYDCGYDFIPSFSLFEDFVKNTLDSNVEVVKGMYKNRKVLPVLFHGNKDHNYIDIAIKMIEDKTTA